MRLNPPQAAPTFEVKDVNGTSINLSDYRGKKILLSFYRNVGCPICNRRFNELQNEASYFKDRQVILLSVYESKVENMRQYLEGETVYTTMIPNPDESLYSLYKIELSMGIMMIGMFHGAMCKMKRGKKLFQKSKR